MGEDSLRKGFPMALLFAALYIFCWSLAIIDTSSNSIVVGFDTIMTLHQPPPFTSHHLELGCHIIRKRCAKDGPYEINILQKISKIWEEIMKKMFPEIQEFAYIQGYFFGKSDFYPTVFFHRFQSTKMSFNSYLMMVPHIYQ